MLFRLIAPAMLLFCLLASGCTRDPGTGEYGRYSAVFVHWVYQTHPIPGEMQALLDDASLRPEDPTIVPRLHELANRQSFVNQQFFEASPPKDRQRYHEGILRAAQRFDEETAGLRADPAGESLRRSVELLRTAENRLLGSVIGCY